MHMVDVNDMVRKGFWSHLWVLKFTQGSYAPKFFFVILSFFFY